MAVSSKNLWVDMKELLLEQYRGNLREEIESGTYVDKEGVERHYELPEGADNRLQGLLKSITDELVQPLDDAAVALQDVANVETAEGAWLDLIGKIAGVGRKIDETDENYRVRVRNALGFKNAGTPDGTIYSTALLSGDPRPQYFDEADCTFFVYTGARPVMVSSQNVVTENGQNLTTEAGGSLMTEPIETSEWEQGGRQLKREQVRRMAPAGVLGLPGEGLQFADGSFIGDFADRIFLSVADDNDVPFVVDCDLVTDEGLTIVTDTDAVLSGLSKEG